MPQAFPEKPVGDLQAPLLDAPVPRGGPDGLVKLLGADHIIFGSDYPHVEGLADPLSYVDELAGLPEEDIRKIMGGNMMEPARSQGPGTGLTGPLAEGRAMEVTWLREPS